MSKTTDLLVIGSGLAGLTAALTAVKRGQNVCVLSDGMGSLSLSGGYIDLLGYDSLGQRLDNPWQGMQTLAQDHPYSLLGEENIQSALDETCESIAASGLKLCPVKDSAGKPRNVLVPTIMGTLKPSYLVPEDYDASALDKAQRILVIGVQGFRDCRPGLIIDQLRRYPGFGQRQYSQLHLPCPFNDAKRSLNSLDLARAVERPHGREWLLGALKDKGQKFDLILIPPICGDRASSTLRRELSATAGCAVIEMLAVPPGVGGLRLRDALIHALRNLDVEFVENARAISANVSDGLCQSLTIQATGREYQKKARAFVLATGGILAGGIELGEGTAKEAVFGLNLPVPENVDQWTNAEIFGQHPITRLGVQVDSDMRVQDSDKKALFKNVFFAGRTLGGYDFASEKSGHGVAIASGWQAGRKAAEFLRGAGQREERL